MKNIIVTGANGFVGSAVCKELSKKGYYIYAIVRSIDSDISRLVDLNNITILYYDMNNLEDLVQEISNDEFLYFFHFAWEGTSGEVRSNYNIQINNIVCSCKAVEVAAKLKCKRFVYASSIMSYEVQENVKDGRSLPETSFYSVSKMSAEYCSRIIANKYDLEFVCGVISNIYGPGEISSRLVNTTIRKLLKREYCKFTPGEQEYDFIYIDDSAEAFRLLAEKGKNNQSYYIGSRKSAPLKKFLVEIRDAIAPSEKIGIGEIPFDGISLKYEKMDMNKIYRDTGFLPKTDFKEGIIKTAEWILKNEESIVDFS